MAARKNLTHDAKTRERIKSSQLINALVKHALGECEMSNTQVRAAEILLRKTIPDLSAIEMSGETTTTFVVDSNPLSVDEWQTKHKPSGNPSPAPSTH